MHFPDYQPYEGFYDLRYYNLPFKIFKKLWHIQRFLYSVNKKKKYYKTWNPGQWKEAQELSGEYQKILFQYDGSGADRQGISLNASRVIFGSKGAQGAGEGSWPQNNTGQAHQDPIGNRQPYQPLPVDIPDDDVPF